MCMGSRPETQVWAFFGSQGQWWEGLPSHGTLLHPGPDLDAHCPGEGLWWQGRQQVL